MTPRLRHRAPHVPLSTIKPANVNKINLKQHKITTLSNNLQISPISPTVRSIIQYKNLAAQNTPPPSSIFNISQLRKKERERKTLYLFKEKRQKPIKQKPFFMFLQEPELSLASETIVLSFFFKLFWEIMTEVLSKTNLFSSGNYQTRQHNTISVFTKSCRLKGFPSRVKPQGLRSQISRSSSCSDFYGKRVVVHGNQSKPRRGYLPQASVVALVSQIFMVWIYGLYFDFVFWVIFFLFSCGVEFLISSLFVIVIVGLFLIIGLLKLLWFRLTIEWIEGAGSSIFGF